uniref:Uncharacterized protein n=1 Tax=Spermophilus dauricus TaxID=99837 RepID=A0A8C9Q1D2_SPEDA
MPLEEKCRAIETQKKRMEALSAWQRLKLGKATFLHVKKGKADGTPHPLRPKNFCEKWTENGGVHRERDEMMEGSNR